MERETNSQIFFKLIEAWEKRTFTIDKFSWKAVLGILHCMRVEDQAEIIWSSESGYMVILSHQQISCLVLV